MMLATDATNSGKSFLAASAGMKPKGKSRARGSSVWCAAKTDSGPCVKYVGPDGAGHFVKMVHNGIEYGVMQLIAEAYDLVRRALGLSAAQTAALFAEWNRGQMERYLIEIASPVRRAG